MLKGDKTSKQIIKMDFFLKKNLHHKRARKGTREAKQGCLGGGRQRALVRCEPLQQPLTVHNSLTDNGTNVQRAHIEEKQRRSRFRTPESKSESALLIKGTVQSSSSRWRHRKSACLHQSHHFHVLREEWRRSWREAGRDATRTQRLPLVFKEAGSDVAADQCRPFCREPLKAVGVLDLL